jgi:hypothetical protein
MMKSDLFLNIRLQCVMTWIIVSASQHKREYRKMKITTKKIGEDRHGPIRSVEIDGVKIGVVGKWHSLFTVAGFCPFDTQKAAIDALIDQAIFNDELPAKEEVTA